MGWALFVVYIYSYEETLSSAMYVLFHSLWRLSTWRIRCVVHCGQIDISTFARQFLLFSLWHYAHIVWQNMQQNTTFWSFISMYMTYFICELKRLTLFAHKNKPYNKIVSGARACAFCERGRIQKGLKTFVLYTHIKLANFSNACARVPCCWQLALVTEFSHMQWRSKKKTLCTFNGSPYTSAGRRRRRTKPTD